MPVREGGAPNNEAVILLMTDCLSTVTPAGTWKHAQQEEAVRLAMKLASFATTESQDRAALERNRNPIRDWRERTLVEFRLLRKQALRLTTEAISAALKAPQQASSAREVMAPTAH